eukprot:jgi/Galph1/5675/GphlegSOOS_G4384.1
MSSVAFQGKNNIEVENSANHDREGMSRPVVNPEETLVVSTEKKNEQPPSASSESTDVPGREKSAQGSLASEEVSFQEPSEEQVETESEAIKEVASNEPRENIETVEETWIDTIQVPKEAVGFIIGKGGETIKDLSLKSGAHIEVERRDADATSDFRLFWLRGNEQSIQYAKQLIMEKVAGVLVGYNQNISSVSSTGSVQAELWIPVDRVGVIIGVGGQTIKSLEEQSQATIVVHNDKVNAVGEKLVTVVGKSSQVHFAQQLIQEIIQKPRTVNPNTVSPSQYPGFLASPELPYSSRATMRPFTNKTIFVPRRSIGMIIGKHGETIRDLQYRSGASIRVVPDSQVPTNTIERPIILSGSLESVELAHNLINDIVNEGIERLGGDPYHTMSLYPTASISVRIQIPNDKVGWIIGRGGSTIRELQQRSGARIQVSRPSETECSTDSRPLTITGPPPFVEVAKHLIYEKLSGYYLRQFAGQPAESPSLPVIASESDLPVAAFGTPLPQSAGLVNYGYEMNPYLATTTMDPAMFYSMYGYVYPSTSPAASASLSPNTANIQLIPEQSNLTNTIRKETNKANVQEEQEMQHSYPT